MNNKNIKGFTLAEVLVTLSILGVVAAISIPNMIQQYQKRLTITKLQKAYSNLQAAATNIQFNSGCFNQDISCIGMTGGTSTNDEKLQFTNKLRKWSNFDSVPNSLNNFWGYVKYLKDDGKSQLGSLYALAKTKDGIMYVIQPNGSFSFDKVCGIREQANALVVYVITEPFTLQNMQTYSTKLKYGKNFFVFAIDNKFEVTPVTLDERSFSCPSNTASNASIDQFCIGNHKGFGNLSCAAKIIQDGWKINY